MAIFWTRTKNIKKRQTCGFPPFVDDKTGARILTVLQVFTSPCCSLQLQLDLSHCEDSPECSQQPEEGWQTAEEPQRPFINTVRLQLQSTYCMQNKTKHAFVSFYLSQSCLDSCNYVLCQLSLSCSLQHFKTKYLNERLLIYGL